MTKKIKVVHIITSLLPDGAQQMLLKLCRVYDRERFAYEVISLRSGGEIETRLGEIGVPVRTLAMYRAIPTPRAVLRLRREISTSSPDILQGWMYHGNAAASAAAGLRRRQAVMWNIRRALPDLTLDRFASRLVIKMNALCSSSVDRIIYCGSSVAAQHEAFGFAGKKRAVVPNGFEPDIFKPDEEAAAALRIKLGLSPKTLLVGHVARFHPQKDHQTFLEAAAAAASVCPSVCFLLIGRDVNESNRELAAEIAKHGLSRAVKLLGQQGGLAKILPGLDVCCQSSAAEGFPNAIGEAMSCAVPCVVTDTGASAELVEKTGFVVPTRSPASLAKALIDMLRLPEELRRSLGSAARQRILNHYTIESVARLYEQQYLEVPGTLT